MMKRNKRFMLLLAAALCVTVLMSGCQKEPDEAVTPAVTLAPLETINQDKLSDYTSDGETVAYLTGLRASFANLAETDRAEFTLTEITGGWRIEEYKGSAEKVRVPASIDGKPVIALANGAFVGNTALKALYLPDSIGTVGTNLLTDCTSLQALRTPLLGADADSKQYLGYFFGAKQYTDNPMEIPSCLAYLELGGTMNKLADFALFECNDLELVSFGENIKTLGRYSMYGCTGLLAADVQHVECLSDHAMDTCSSLTSLSFGAGLQSMGLGALEGCVELRTLEVPFVGGSATENNFLAFAFGAEVPEFAQGYYPTYLTRVTVTGELTALGDYAFYQCETLTELSLPSSVTAIGTRAFSGCMYLKELVFPTALTSIGDNAFFGCRSLKKLDLSGTALTKIGVNAFYYCDALTEVILPDTLTTLPPSCFAGCIKLTSINLEHVTDIGEQAFRGCKALTLPEEE